MHSIARNCYQALSVPAGATGLVPTLVPKQGSSGVTEEHLPESEFTALRALELAWVMLDREIRSLKIRVSVVRLTRISLS
jgi:hypothetical protein